MEEEPRKVFTLYSAIKRFWEYLKSVFFRTGQTAGFKKQWQGLPRQGRCSWDKLDQALNANGGWALKQIQKLKDGGLLFGFDEEGNALFADASEELPEFTFGAKYGAIREAILQDGFELFPSESDSDQKSYEITLFEANTGLFFVRPKDRSLYLSSWLESGDVKKNGGPYAFIYFNPSSPDSTQLSYGRPYFPLSTRGVRRLLRVPVIID